MSDPKEDALLHKAKEKLVETKTAMLLHAPFFASLVLDMMKIEVGRFPHVFGTRPATAATDGKHIYLDIEFFSKLKVPQAVFLLCHEIGHAMWHHMSRAKKYEATGIDGKKFSFGKWNRAGDYVINDMLVAAKIGDFIEGGLLDKRFDHKTHMADDVYRLLPDDPSDGGGGNGLDTHIPASGDGASEAEWQRAVQSAYDSAKAQGNMPDSLKRIIDQLLNPKVDWKELLRTAIMKAASKDAHTWARPHRRRLITQGIVLPSYTGYGAGDIVVAVDTSGSIGQHELTVFLTEVQSILDIARPTRVYLVPCDAKVHTVTELSCDDSLVDAKPPCEGGGGTSFKPPFEWVEKEGLRPSALVYLTDMMGDFPSEPPPYKTIWCSTTAGVKGPFGDTVEIEIKSYER